MLILLLKADQLGLFDKIVPVAGSVKHDGTVTKPHFGRRKVRLHSSTAAAPAAQSDLFADHYRKPAQPKPEKPAPAVGDLFGPTPTEKARSEALDALKERVVRFASGMSREKDFAAAIHGEHGVGVEVRELSDDAMRELARLIVEKRAKVFVDSGAFGDFKRGAKAAAAGEAPAIPPLDFDEVLKRYEKLGEYIADANDAEERVYPPLVVVPDVVGDQAASLDLVAKHRNWIKVESEFNILRPVVPLQRGDLSLGEAYDRVVSILGTDNFICGIPSNAAAVSAAEFTDFLRTRQPKAVHILGALHEKRLFPRLQQIVDAGVADSIQVSADANVLRSQIIERGVTGLERSGRIVEKLGAPGRQRELRNVLDDYGGADGIRKLVAEGTEDQALRLVGLLSDLSGKTPDEVRTEYGLPDGPREGETRIVEGVRYVLRDSRWRRDETQPEPPPPAPGRDDGPFDLDKVPTFGVPAGTSKEERRRINAEAAALVDAKSEFTDADRALLRRYSGNGGCGDSLNEFYTDPGVAAAMWFTLRNMGLPDGAAVLEPSCATGVFLEVAPRAAKVTGVELDPTSAKIGAVLHPAHEVENASLERFAVRDARQFDAVIGNAPFGLRGSLIKDDKPELKTAEGYFLDTALDKTRPGGIVAMIVPTGVLDGKNSRGLRERLLRKAEFLGALRMPNTAFEHSHTGVTSDIVYLRKRPEDVAGALMTVKQETLKAVGVWDDEFLAGRYFTGSGAGNVLGTMTEGWRAKAGMGDDITVEGSMVGVPEAIAAFQPRESTGGQPDVPAILAALGNDDAAKSRALTGSLRRPYDNAKPGDTKVVDGVEYVLQGRPPRWHRVDEFMQSAAVTDGQELARDIDRVMTAYGGSTDTALQRTLADRVRAYVEKHGIPGKNADLLLVASQDKALYRLIGAVRPDGSLSDVVANRSGTVLESSFDAAAQTLALELRDFTPEQVAARWHGGDAEAALDHLHASHDYALNPDGTWTSADNYLSGDLWPKLDAAKAELGRADLKPEDRGKFERQARVLEETIDPKALEDVEIALNSAFLPLNVVAAFFNERLAQKKAEGHSWMQGIPPMSIKFDKGIYTITGGEQYGEDSAGLLEKYLNRTGVRKDDLPTIERWTAAFKTWLCASKYRDDVEELYNRKFRGFRQQEYSTKPFEIPGLAANDLNPYQYSGLRWALEAGKGIVAADVGLGKTVRGLMLARMLKVTGRAKRPMIIVPKSVLANWAAEAEKWFPGSRVLVIGETYSKDKAGKLKAKQDTAAERNRKFHDLTQNDYDFVFISQPAWNDLDVDPIQKGQYASDDFWVQRGDSLGNAGDKRLNKIRESYNQALAQREFQKRTDAIYFNDLGVDALIADEMHAFKNLYAARNRFGQQPKFLGGQGLSNRALDMSFKARWVREQTGGRNVYGLTATPTKNSPLEIYSMLSFIAPEAFERIGVRNSEEFLDRFCEFKNENVLSTSGEIEEALVTAGFKNLDELREIMRRYIDRKTAADVGLKLPGRDDRLHLVDMSPEQQNVYADLREAAVKAAKDGDATGDAHIFSIMDKMGKAAMDLELYDPTRYAGADSPKYSAAAKEIAAGAADGGQVVFADSIGVHQKMVDALVKEGIPRDQIAVINAQAAASSAQRQNIADAFNAGKLRVVIGNTATMGEGINLQKGTTDIHHMDLPWEPASMQQRNGRGLRQGNVKESVRIHTYLAKGSFDGYRYQSMMAKKDWQDLLWNGGDRVANLAREGSMSRDEMLIMLAADPEHARQQYEENKAAARQRFDAQKRGEAAEVFVKFQEMKASLKALKGKSTPSALRLKQKIERAREQLSASEFFPAKGALDADHPVVIQPQTGEAYHAGVAFEMEGHDKAAIAGGGKFVVLRANPAEGTVVARRYGEANTHPLHLKLADLRDGVKTVAYDEAAERADIGRALEEAAKAKVSTVASMKDLAVLPHSVIESSYAPIQQQVKQGLREYKFNTGHGPIGLLDKDGQPVAHESYEARKHLDDHDVMLPIPDHREKAIAAFVADERGKKFTNEYFQRRKNSQSERRFVVRYPGGYSQSTNRWASIGREVFGETFEHDAKAAFERGQGERARRAPTFSTAIAEVAPMVKADYSGVKWPRRGLAILWAKAKQQGNLDLPFRSEIPQEMQYGRMVPSLPSDLFKGAVPQATYDGLSDKTTVRSALVNLARAGNHNDLAAAMIVSGASGRPEAAMKEMLTLPVKDQHVIEGIRHLVAKHPDLGERPLTEFGHNGYQYQGGRRLISVNDLIEPTGDDRRAA